MTENLLNSARNPQPAWKRKLKQAGRAIQSWLRELNRLIVLLIFSAGGAFKLAHTTQIDPRVAFGVSIVPSLCLFPSCMNISARILPELTPLGIAEQFNKPKIQIPNITS